MYFRNYIIRRKIKLVQLADIIINDMNIKRNDIVMVYCSLSHITLSDSKPEDLIYLLKMIVGTKGTVLMPAYSKDHTSAGPVHNIRGTNIHNNIFYELFRQMPDTFHSSNFDEPFAAWGSMGKKFAEDHNNRLNEPSIYNLLYNLSLVKAKIIGIGIPLKDFLVLLTYNNNFGKDSTVDQELGRRNIYTLSGILKSKSPEKLSEFFKEGESNAFIKRGIPFFALDADKIYNKDDGLTGNG